MTLKKHFLIFIASCSLITPQSHLKAELPPYVDSCIFATVAGTAFYIGNLLGDKDFLGTTAKDFAAALGVYALWRGYTQLSAKKTATPQEIAKNVLYDSLYLTADGLTAVTTAALWNKLPETITNNLGGKTTAYDTTVKARSTALSLAAATTLLGYRSYKHPLKRKEQLTAAKNALASLQIEQLLRYLRSYPDGTIEINFPSPHLAASYYKNSGDPKKPSPEAFEKCTTKKLVVTASYVQNSQFFEKLTISSQQNIHKVELQGLVMDQGCEMFLRSTLSNSPLLLPAFQNMPLTRSALAFVGIKILIDLHDAIYKYYFPVQQKNVYYKPLFQQNAQAA